MALVDSAQREALDAWIVATAPRAVAYAMSLLGNRASAEDIVQDCYCRLLAKSDQYDLPRDGIKLLFRSITNACINLSRRARTVSLEGAGRQDENDSWELPDEASLDPAEGLLHAELKDQIAAGLGRLPVLYRAALELKSLGQSHEEIAAALDVTPSYAGVLVHRARQQMAAFLAKYVEEGKS